MTLLNIKYRRRRKGDKVIIFTPEWFFYKEVTGDDAWKKAGKIIDNLNNNPYE